MNECKLFKEKDYENLLNEYNHNYEGKYCSCNEEEDDNEMIQCFICEDWYHIRHLNFKGELTENDEGDLICHQCFKKPCFNFIIDYSFEGFMLFPCGDTNTQTSQPQVQCNNNPSPSPIQSSRKGKRTLAEAFGNSSCISNSIINPKGEIECNRLLSNEQIKRNSKRIYNIILEEKYDVIVSMKVLESKICHCDKCTEIYSKHKLPFIENDFYVKWVTRIPFETKINHEINEDTEENRKILEKDDLSIIMNSKLKELDVEKQVMLSLVNKEFFSQFKDYLLSIKPIDNTELVVTYEHIQDFLAKFKKTLDK